MKQPKVSIITVYYNRGYCVDRSVQSLLEQTFEDFELLLVDDGSGDDTVERFSKLSDERIRIVSHENMGFVASIRKAVDMASGDYIAIHGSGDLSSKERIHKLCDFLDSNPDYNIVASRFERLDEETGERIEVSQFTGDIDYNDFIYNCRIMHGAVMYRKSVYEMLGGYEPIFTVTQDWDLFARFLKLGKGRILEDLLYTQYKRQDGVMAHPKKFSFNLKLVALRIRLATDPENREETLKEVRRIGLDLFIKPSDSVYQTVFVNRLCKLVKYGDFETFLSFRKEFDSEKLGLKLKLRYRTWLNVAKILKALNMDKRLILKVYARLNYMKALLK